MNTSKCNAAWFLHEFDEQVAQNLKNVFSRGSPWKVSRFFSIGVPRVPGARVSNVGSRMTLWGGGSPGVEDKIEMTQAWPRGSRKMKRWNKNAGTLQEAQTLKTNDTKATREGGEGMTSRGIIVNYYELIRITKDYYELTRIT